MGARGGLSGQARSAPRPPRRLVAWARARRRHGAVPEAAATIAHEFHIKPLARLAHRVPGERERRLDEREVGERLGEVPDEPTRARLPLLRQQSHVVSKCE